MRRPSWSLPTLAWREIAGGWRAIVGLLLAAVGLFAVPVATAGVIDRVASEFVSATPPDATLGTPWVPTTNASRVASTTITVESTTTGARLRVTHVLELTPTDLLYDAVRGKILDPQDVIDAVIGSVGIRFGGITPAEQPDYERFQLDRTPGSLARVTITDSETYEEFDFTTAAPQIVFAPPTDRRAAATSTTVVVRGVGYALDAVLTGDPTAERATETRFVDPAGPFDVRLFRTAAAATEGARSYGNFEPATVPALFRRTFEPPFLAVLLPWLVFFVGIAMSVRATAEPRGAVRADTAPRDAVRAAAVWTLVGGIVFIGAGESAPNTVAVVAVPLLLAGWLLVNRSWTPTPFLLS